MTTIEYVHGREILDSRGNPTVEVEVVLADGSYGEPQSRQVLQPAHLKPLNCVTAMQNAISAKVF